MSAVRRRGSQKAAAKASLAAVLPGAVANACKASTDASIAAVDGNRRGQAGKRNDRG
eukprot:CAMPEP_0206475924 /NCGR_PEP_ID=MMETSP0324_2-20121206/34385_1 /ASSEMBLY_ACC=CAM_ASM_000836 /TAXON_ID=2866 /ORGANISM="Crypthecodinium cohnii, Strain Seligo" /LENGTH=56 /DNA_ID=CAMNT_0053951407 /DNA_START=496 /DNA_END=666 /DNA_ORIENTATION=-